MRYTAVFLCLFSFLLFSKVQVIQVDTTLQPDNARIIIVYPENGQFFNSEPIKMQIRATDFALGEDSDFDRKNEIINSNMGQNIHIIIDNQDYFAKVNEQTDPFNDEGILYDTMIEFSLPKLSEGQHVLRAFLCRSFNESLKNFSSMDTNFFYYKNKTPLKGVDLKKPYLTYNEPSPHISYDQKPILLDFLVNNCELSSDGYKVKLLIDDKIIRVLDKYTPYYIYGLEKGSHSIRLQLIDKMDKVVDGLFNDVKKEIKVQ